MEYIVVLFLCYNLYMSKLLFEILNEKKEQEMKQKDSSELKNVIKCEQDTQNSKNDNVEEKLDSNSELFVMESQTIDSTENDSQNNTIVENQINLELIQPNLKTDHQDDIKEKSDNVFSKKINDNQQIQILKMKSIINENNIFNKNIKANLFRTRNQGSTKNELIDDVHEITRKDIKLEIFEPNPAEIRKNVLNKIKKEKFDRVEKKKVSLDDWIEEDPVLGALVDQLKYVKALKNSLKQKQNLTKEKVEEIEKLLDENLKILEGK